MHIAWKLFKFSAPEQNEPFQTNLTTSPPSVNVTAVSGVTDINVSTGMNFKFFEGHILLPSLKKYLHFSNNVLQKQFIHPYAKTSHNVQMLHQVFVASLHLSWTPVRPLVDYASVKMQLTVQKWPIKFVKIFQDLGKTVQRLAVFVKIQEVNLIKTFTLGKLT